jgi:hypothetical protein
MSPSQSGVYNTFPCNTAPKGLMSPKKQRKELSNASIFGKEALNLNAHAKPAAGAESPVPPRFRR